MEDDKGINGITTLSSLFSTTGRRIQIGIGIIAGSRSGSSVVNESDEVGSEVVGPSAVVVPTVIAVLAPTFEAVPANLSVVAATVVGAIVVPTVVNATGAIVVAAVVVVVGVVVVVAASVVDVVVAATVVVVGATVVDVVAVETGVVVKTVTVEVSAVTFVNDTSWIVGTVVVRLLCIRHKVIFRQRRRPVPLKCGRCGRPVTLTATSFDITLLVCLNSLPVVVSDCCVTVAIEFGIKVS